MQTVAQTIEIVSYITATPRNRVNQLARALVSAGVFPKSVGRDVKKIDGGQVLGLLAAVAYAQNVADAPSIATSFMELPTRGGEGFEPPESTLADVFTQSMAYEKWQGAELELAIVASGYVATLTGEIIIGDQSISGSIPFWVEQSQGGWVKRSFVIDHHGVTLLRNLFCRDDNQGVSFSGATSVGRIPQ